MGAASGSGSAPQGLLPRRESPLARRDCRMRNLDKEISGSGIDDRMNFRFVFVRDLFYHCINRMMDHKANYRFSTERKGLP